MRCISMSETISVSMSPLSLTGLTATEKLRFLAHMLLTIIYLLNKVIYTMSKQNIMLQKKSRISKDIHTTYLPIKHRN